MAVEQTVYMSCGRHERYKDIDYHRLPPQHW